MEPAAVRLREAVLYIKGRSKASETWRQNADAQRGLRQELSGGRDSTACKQELGGHSPENAGVSDMMSSTLFAHIPAMSRRTWRMGGPCLEDVSAYSMVHEDVPLPRPWCGFRRCCGPSGSHGKLVVICISLLGKLILELPGAIDLRLEGPCADACASSGPSCRMPFYEWLRVRGKRCRSRAVALLPASSGHKVFLRGCDPPADLEELHRFLADCVRQNTSALLESIAVVEHEELVDHTLEERLIYRR